ncbi:MAG: ornithine cyclodeaminase family protein [Dorea sp.]|jgi:ornithine cyclodeaminase/alanine dehydrogenase-like protein (mu-crystallin family)|nr:ornithine cyclodeaminase family protein [Dorea sp.]
MLLLSREDIKKVFTMRDAIQANKKAFQLLVDGKCNAPLRTNIQAPKQEGCFLFMPAYVEEMDTASLKIVNVFPHNIEQGLPALPAQVMLIDGKTGVVQALMDGIYVTQLRTGAASGAAFDVLAKKECKIGALIGTGGQGEAQLEAMLEARRLEEVRICGLHYDRTKVFVERMQKEMAHYGAKLIPVMSSEEAIEDADLVITATPAEKPVFDGEKIKKGATVSCIGSYQHHMQEMSPTLLTRASKIYFDSQEAVLSEAGDILIPLEEGIITKEDFTGDLGNVLKGEVTGRTKEDEIIVFKSVGVAAQDLVAAREIYKRAVKSGIGMQWN